MQARIDYGRVAPGVVQAMLGPEQYVPQSGLDPSLLELVRTRASQLNGCAFCLGRHTRDARAAGESEQRLYALSAWREAPFFTDRQRAALAWIEAVTHLDTGHVPDEVFDAARQRFGEKELVDLTRAVVAINGWNRLAISTRAVPGGYQPQAVGHTACGEVSETGWWTRGARWPEAGGGGPAGPALGVAPADGRGAGTGGFI